MRERKSGEKMIGRGEGKREKRRRRREGRIGRGEGRTGVVRKGSFRRGRRRIETADTVYV